jgi:hypothetical protein
MSEEEVADLLGSELTNVKVDGPEPFGCGTVEPGCTGNMASHAVRILMG